MLRRTGNVVSLSIVRYLRGLKFEELREGISKADVATPASITEKGGEGSKATSRKKADAKRKPSDDDSLSNSPATRPTGTTTVVAITPTRSSTTATNTSKIAKQQPATATYPDMASNSKQRKSSSSSLKRAASCGAKQSRLKVAPSAKEQLGQDDESLAATESSSPKWRRASMPKENLLQSSLTVLPSLSSSTSAKTSIAITSSGTSTNTAIAATTAAVPPPPPSNAKDVLRTKWESVMGPQYRIVVSIRCTGYIPIQIQ